MTRTSAAEAAIYEDLEDRVTRIARGIASQAKYRDGEELVSHARLIFLEAVRSHDPARGTLERRVVFLVRNRLKDRMRDAQRRSAILAQADVDPDTVTCEDAPRFDRDGLMSRLGPDGRAVVDLVLSCPAGLAAVDNGPASRGWLRRYLGDLGWAADRAAAAFAEVRSALSRG